MKIYSFVFCFFLFNLLLFGQVPITPIIECKPKKEGEYEFYLKNLKEIKKHYPGINLEYLWEFGDGRSSIEERPTHVFQKANFYTVKLYISCNSAGANIDRNPVKEIWADSCQGKVCEKTDDDEVYFPEGSDAIVLASGDDPAPGDQLVLRLSYRPHHGAAPSQLMDGFLDLQIEKEYSKHFEIASFHNYHNETLDDGMEELSFAEANFGKVSTSPVFLASTDIGYLPESNNYATDFSKNEIKFETLQRFKFDSLRAGEERNIYVVLNGTSRLTKDTTYTIFLKGIYKTTKGVEKEYPLKLTINTSYDPNNVGTRPGKLPYRGIDGKDETQLVTYLVKIQNIGEATADSVTIKMPIKEGLDPNSLQITDFSFRGLRFCADSIQGNCLDTLITQDTITFIFRGIHLPPLKGENKSPKKRATKGHLEFTLNAMRNLSGTTIHTDSSSIGFDKNEHILTNSNRVEFTNGFSLGALTTYRIHPRNSALSHFTYGLSLSFPYRLWGWYLQAEISYGEIGSDNSLPSIGPVQGQGQFNPPIGFPFVSEPLPIPSKSVFLPIMLKHDFQYASVGFGMEVQYEWWELFRYSFGQLSPERVIQSNTDVGLVCDVSFIIPFGKGNGFIYPRLNLGVRYVHSLTEKQHSYFQPVATLKF